MAVHNPNEFDGNCPKCGYMPDFLETTKNEEGETIVKYFCSECNIKIVVNDETDEIEETYDA